MQKKGRN